MVLHYLLIGFRNVEHQFDKEKKQWHDTGPRNRPNP